MTSEDEFFDAVEDNNGYYEKSSIPLIVEGRASPKVEEEEREKIEIDPNTSMSVVSLESSELSVHRYSLEGEEEETTHQPRLSRYLSSLTGLHPLSALAPPKGGGAHIPSDSVSDIGGTDGISGGDSKSSLGTLSIMLSDEGLRTKPRKIRVRSKKKSKSEFSKLALIQELSTLSTRPTSDLGSSNPATLSSPTPLFSAKFSFDGNYLAVAGEDGLIRVWKLLVEDTMALMTERLDNNNNNHTTTTDGGGGGGDFITEYSPPRMAAIFQQEPIQVFEGHSASVLDLSWSKNNFLLSASMDRTVRLWHYSRSDCLGVFRHPDFVTSVAFHPRDDRIFVTGSLDCRLRLWSIADKAVRAWNELPADNFVTAVSFTSSGKLVLAGTTTGVCLIFDTDGFNYSTQIHVHSRRGKNKIGKKICGIEAMPGNAGDEKILISTNDSRIRLYTLRDKSIISKFIGHSNDSSQIKGTFSDDGEYVISGSEDNKIFIWNVENRYQQRSLFSRTPQAHVKACEFFETHSKPVTCAIFAPSIVGNRLQSVGLRPILGGGNTEEGQIIVAVDLNGRIKIYENNSLLEGWLNGSNV